jgi:hypothetical protein
VYNSGVMRVLSILLVLSCAGPARAADPVIDNERVIVWDTTSALPPAQHDFVAVSLSRKGTAVFGRKGQVPAKAGAHTVVIELKDHAVTALANTSGLPLAFPRPHVRKLFENDRIVVWDYAWHAGVATPMHFHDKDALVVHEANGVLKSTTPDGKSVDNTYKTGDIRFNARDRAHTELLVSGKAHAVITELK